MSTQASLDSTEQKSTRETWEIAIGYITGRRRVEQALGFLAEASYLLASSIDCSATLPAVAALAVPYLGDWCSIDLLDERGGLSQAALSSSALVDGAVNRALRLYLHPQGAAAEAGVLHVLASGLTERVTASGEPGASARAAHLAEIGGSSSLVVPVLVRSEVIGAITLASLRIGTGKAYGRPEEALLEQLALRVASAVEIARLHGCPAS